MPKDALPDRYVVDRRGTPDPEGAEYYVLDVVHDRHARTVLGALVNWYRQSGQHTSADELDRLLLSTSAAHGKVIKEFYESRNPARKKSSARKSGGEGRI